MSSCAPGSGVRPPRLKENVLLTPRLLIAKFRSREGNRGVFFLISVSSFTDNPSSQTILSGHSRTRGYIDLGQLDSKVKSFRPLLIKRLPLPRSSVFNGRLIVGKQTRSVLPYELEIRGTIRGAMVSGNESGWKRLDLRRRQH